MIINNTVTAWAHCTYGR